MSSISRKYLGYIGTPPEDMAQLVEELSPEGQLLLTEHLKLCSEDTTKEEGKECQTQ